MTAGDIITISENAFGKKSNIYSGTDDSVLHDAHAVARVAAGDTVGTYSAWIYPDNIVGSKCILSIGDADSGAQLFMFKLNGNQSNVYLTSGATVNQYNIKETTGSIVARKWQHVAIVHNGIRPTLYVNGKAVTVTDVVSADLTQWYGDLSACDKFSIGALTSNTAVTQEFVGAIGQVKYWNKALTSGEILKDFQGTALDDDPTYLQLNVTYENDGTTDSGLGADNGTYVSAAFYGGTISDWSYKVHENITGHAAEFINTLDIGQGKFLTLIKRGD